MHPIWRKIVGAVAATGLGVAASSVVAQGYYERRVAHTPLIYYDPKPWWAIRRVPDHKYNQNDVWRKTNPADIKPKKMKAYIDQDIELFRLLPDQHKTQKLCNHVINQRPDMLAYIPVDKRTNKMFNQCKESINNFRDVALSGSKFNELFAGKQFAMVLSEEDAKRISPGLHSKKNYIIHYPDDRFKVRGDHWNDHMYIPDGYPFYVGVKSSISCEKTTIKKVSIPQGAHLFVKSDGRVISDTVIVGEELPNDMDNLWSKIWKQPTD